MALLETDIVDLLLDSNGDLVISGGDAQWASGEQGVLQGIRIACRMVQGEWFLNLDTGVPYFARDGIDPATVIMGQAFDQLRALAAFRQAIVNVPGVGSLDFLDVSYTNAGRLLTVQFSVTCSFGGTVADSLALGM
jgi:hypothetical protein